MTYKEVFEEILHALDVETEQRPRRLTGEWITRERVCVWATVNKIRDRFGLPAVAIADVERAEKTAVGHSDYVRKYAHAAADLVLRERNSPKVTGNQGN